jgi:hypothetical protein
MQPRPATVGPRPDVVEIDGIKMMRGGAACVALALGLFLTAELHATPLPLRITWRESAGCNIEQSVTKRVELLVGDAGARAAAVQAQIRLRQVAGGFRVTLTTLQLSQSGEREFDATSCDRAADAIALVLSVMLSPPGTADTVKTKGFPGGAQPSAIAVPAPLPAAGREARPAARPLEHGVRVGLGPRVGGDIGSLPKPTLFGGAGAWVAAGRVRGVVRALVWVPRDTDDGPRPGAGATVGMYAASGGGCFAVVEQLLTLEPCLSAELGVSRGRGRGIRSPAETTALWAAVMPALAVRAPARLLPASIALEVPVVLSRPEYTIDGFGSVYRASAVAFRLSLSVDLVLP